jgi:hypothetical protein
MPDTAASRKRQIRGCRTLSANNDSSAYTGGAQAQSLGGEGFPRHGRVATRIKGRAGTGSQRHSRHTDYATHRLYELERLATAYRRSSGLLDGAAPPESAHVAIATVPGSEMKFILCPENKDYCDPARRARQDLKAAAIVQKLISSRDRIVPGSSVVIEASCAFCAVIGRTMSVAESPHQSLDSESAACREGENRWEQLPAQ